VYVGVSHMLARLLSRAFFGTRPSSPAEDDELEAALHTRDARIIIASSACVLDAIVRRSIRRRADAPLFIDAIDKRACEDEVQWVLRRMRLPCWLCDNQAASLDEVLRLHGVSTLIVDHADLLSHPAGLLDAVGTQTGVVFVVADLAHAARFAHHMRPRAAA